MVEYRSVDQLTHNGLPLREILKNHEKWVKQREGRKADLIGADLRSSDLRDAYLRGAELIKANLRGSNLEKANLGEANLFGADLSGCNLCGANLRRANLERARLREANLQGVDLSDANLKEAYMALADISRAVLLGTALNEAYMRGATLSDADLYKADMRGVKLIGARMERTKLRRAKLMEAKLMEAYLRDAEMVHSDLSRADLSMANLDKANLHSVILRNGNLTRGSLLGTDLSGADISGVCLDGASISAWIITGVTCTHIIRGETREVTSFSPGEFEKKYSKVKRNCEMILAIPLTGSAYYIGRFIARSINSVMNARLVELRGLELLSENETKLIVEVFDETFFQKRKETIEIFLRHALNEHFRDNRIGRDPSFLSGILEEVIPGTAGTTEQEPQGGVDTPPWKINPKIEPGGLIEHCAGLERIGQAIYAIVCSVLTQGPECPANRMEGDRV